MTTLGAMSTPGSAPELRYVLHVGMHKTGTTFLQGLLDHHRDALREAGVLYPKVRGRRSHFHAALDARDIDFFAGAPRDVAGNWQAFVDASRDFHGTVVFSHETLAGADREHIDRLLGSLPSAEVDVVLTARDPARQIVADWQQQVRNGRDVDLDEFVRRSGLLDDPTSPKALSTQQLAHTAERWAGAVSPERVHVVTVPPPGAEPGVLWTRFCQVLGLDPADFPLPDRVERNDSLGMVQLQALLRVNGFIRDRLPRDRFHLVLKQLYAESVLTATAPSAKPVLSAEHQTVADRLGEAWVAGLRDGGYEIVGDLDDLRSRPAEATAPWSDADVAGVLAQGTADLLGRLDEALTAARGSHAPVDQPGVAPGAGSRAPGLPRRALRRLVRLLRSR